MIPIRFDASGSHHVPPNITDLLIEDVQVSDFHGTNYPQTFSAIVDTGANYCVLPIAILDLLKPEFIKLIKVRGYRADEKYADTELYKVRLTLPPDPPVTAYAIFTVTDEILIGRTAMRDYLLHVNFATGSGQLSSVP